MPSTHNPDDASKVVNLYGDSLRNWAKRRGANISSQRIDDLDERCLEYAVSLKRKSRKNFRSLDLGCGTGVQGVRLSLLGYESHLYDQEDLPPPVRAIQDLYELMRLRYHKCNLADLSNVKLPPNGVDICYSQRFIHYLRYAEAEQLLRRIVKSMTPGGHLFISASGKSSEIGTAHPERNEPIRKRFAAIDPRYAEKHSIFDPICVYSAQELEKLMWDVGFITVDLWESDFGNVKGIFSKDHPG